MKKNLNMFYLLSFFYSNYDPHDFMFHIVLNILFF